jgi:hypothetical protein
MRVFPLISVSDRYRRHYAWAQRHVDIAADGIRVGADARAPRAQTLAQIPQKKSDLF